MKEMGFDGEKKLAQVPNVAEAVEAVFGCKWSLRILMLIQSGVCRPGAIERALDGLTPKVQSYYFRRMIDLGILDRIVYAEIPPRVEYQLTEFGSRFVPLLNSIRQLQSELEENAAEQPLVSDREPQSMLSSNSHRRE